MSLLATIVDWEALGDTVLAAFVAGVGVAVTFSLAILGAARVTEAGRTGHRLEAIVFGVLGVVGLLATLLAIVFGIIVMTS
jgi:hypothetical protein